MKPVAFKYAAPTTTQAAVEVLSRYGADAKAMAGGQSLMPLLNMRLARPAVVVDLNRIQQLNYIRPTDGGIAIGALTRQRRLEDDPLVTTRVPLLAAAAKWIGHPQIRNRGTIVGSIAHADPAAELPAAALALDAELTAVGPHGARTLSPDDLYLGYLVTSLEPDELLTEVRFPAMPAGAGWSIQEVARRHGDFALVGVIAVLTLDRDRVGEARLTYFGLAGRAVRLPDVEGMLAGTVPSETLFAQAATQASAVLDADDDIHASAEYRRTVAGVLTRRALREALSRAKRGAGP
jgi:carbon-monoxide dehydrogenase medium subunit